MKLEEFLDNKKDFSHFLVHLTRRKGSLTAKNILDNILSEKVLRAYEHHCVFDKNLRQPEKAARREQFKVVCFTETPLEQIEVLLQPIEGRWYQPEPYGLVFKKKFIREKGGNPVFYATKDIAYPLWQLYWKLGTEEFSAVLHDNICHTLALVTLCDKQSDWHWEREWRIVGELRFKYEDIYCALCRQEYIPFFEDKYDNVTFIDPHWRMNQILDELVNKAKKVSINLGPDDIPF